MQKTFIHHEKQLSLYIILLTLQQVQYVDCASWGSFVVYMQVIVEEEPNAVEMINGRAYLLT